MAQGTINQYLQQVDRAINGADGLLLAELVSFRHPHIQNPRLRVNFEKTCEDYLESPYDEMIAAHIRTVVAVTSNDLVDAYTYQAVVVHVLFGSFLKAFQTQKDDNWGLPVLKMTVLDLRQFALRAEQGQRSTGGGRTAKPGELLEKAADQIMSCFRVCVSDNRASKAQTKRWGTLALVNQLFKIYFRINKLHLCKPLIRAIESSDIKNEFHAAETVTYKYFVGKKAMFDSDFKNASEHLDFAFNRCFVTCRRNKRLILIYLIPVKMLLGQLPKMELLQKYDLMQFADITKAVSQGNLLLFTEALDKNEAFFIHFRVYLILQKLKIIAYRNLFKKVYLLLGTHQLPLAAFEGSLRSLGESDVDGDEVQCIVANLIDKGYIRGYISHQHQKLVVSKQIPFPLLSSVLK